MARRTPEDSAPGTRGSHGTPFAPNQIQTESQLDLHSAYVRRSSHDARVGTGAGSAGRSAVRTPDGAPDAPLSRPARRPGARRTRHLAPQDTQSTGLLHRRPWRYTAAFHHSSMRRRKPQQASSESVQYSELLSPDRRRVNNRITTGPARPRPEHRASTRRTACLHRRAAISDTTSPSHGPARVRSTPPARVSSATRRLAGERITPATDDTHSTAGTLHQGYRQRSVGAGTARRSPEHGARGQDAGISTAERQVMPRRSRYVSSSNVLPDSYR